MTKQLLFSVTREDLEIQTFHAGGPGGQHQNKRSTGVRIIHKPSGARGEARDSRGQYQNRKAAFERMANSSEFKVWLRMEASRRDMDAEDIRRAVRKQMAPWNLLVEVKDEEGQWIEESS